MYDLKMYRSFPDHEALSKWSMINITEYWATMRNTSTLLKDGICHKSLRELYEAWGGQSCTSIARLCWPWNIYLACSPIFPRLGTIYWHLYFLQTSLISVLERLRRILHQHTWLLDSHTAKEHWVVLTSWIETEMAETLSTIASGIVVA